MTSKKILLVANTSWNLWNYRRAMLNMLEKAGYELILLAPEDNFSHRLTAGSTRRFIPLAQLSRRSFSPLQNFRSLLELFWLFKRERPALVLLFTIKPNILGNIAAHLASVPTLSIVEGLGYSGTHARRWRWLAAPLYRLALKQSKKVVFLNQDDAQEFLQNRLVSCTQTRVIHGPGVDTSHFQKTARSAANKVVFMFCGRLLAEKGIREFVAAARQIQQQGDWAKFLVLGSPDLGNPSSIPMAELHAWKKESAVQFLGNTDDVRPHLAKADVLVLPSYYREGVPRSVLEAMAMEKIIVTTDTPGCQDTVEAGKNGFLIPAQNVAALVQVLQNIRTISPEKRQQMGAYSRQKVERDFSDARVLPEYLELIKSLLSETAA